MTYVAIIGWIFFAAAVWLYRKKANAATDDNAALSLLCLAVLFSDAYRKPTREGIEEVVRLAPRSRDTKKLVSGVMSGLLEMARGHMNPKESVPHPFAVVIDHVEKLRGTPSST